MLDEVGPGPIAAAIRQLLADPPDRRATRAHAERFGWDETTRGQAELFGQRAGGAEKRGMTLWLVTGGCGFIGSHLCAALVAAGQRVRVLDNLSTGRRENLAPGAELAGGRCRRPGAAGATPWKALPAASTLPPSPRWSAACANGGKRTG